MEARGLRRAPDGVVVGYEPTRAAGMSLISLNVRFQGQPGPHLLAVSSSQFDPSLPFHHQLCCDAQQHFRATVCGSVLAQPERGSL